MLEPPKNVGEQLILLLTNATENMVEFLLGRYMLIHVEGCQELRGPSMRAVGCPVPEQGLRQQHTREEISEVYGSFPSSTVNASIWHGRIHMSL